MRNYGKHEMASAILRSSIFSAVSIFAIAMIAMCSSSRAESSDRPNIVFILADDLGWSDTTLHGTTKFYQTPNVQRLAARGMMFTRAYSASPLCSPTRASILTGLSPARTGITTPSAHLPKVVLQATEGKQAAPNMKATMPATVTRLKTEYYTLAEALKDAGYATGHFGKWHLGHDPYSPLAHGFDVDVPHWPGPGPAGSYVAPWKFPDFDPDTPNQHLEDRMAKEAVAFLEKHKAEPFFLNYWMFSVHAPFDAKGELIDKHRGRVDPNDPQRSPTYAAMIESMDDAVGTLLDTLDRLGIADNTIVVFASDNGGNMYNEVDGTTPTSNAPLRGGKATMYEGGVRCPCVVIWPGVVAKGSRSDAVTQSCDFYPTLLEMLQLQPREDQQFDGISIVPALHGKSLDRDTIFTYFPHAPRVPDWLPPVASVHRGDWKLIRIFHGGDDGAHRWKLFNLKDDIGEKHDLAKQEPQRVRELDALIENFLVDTAAVRPTPNPNFDPAVYRLEDEGKSRRKAPPAAKAVWQPSPHSRLTVRDAALVITSIGNDPHASFSLPKSLPAGDLQMRFTISSTAHGNGQFFWSEDGATPRFFRDRSELFDINHDAMEHEYRVDFKAQRPVTGVRLDPARAAGDIRVSAMRLTDAAGKTLYQWTFRPSGS
jgi:arylsulfatase A-like enzyme